MFRIIKEILSGLNDVGTGNKYDPLRRFYGHHCCGTCNSCASLSLRGDKLNMRPACGIMPAEFTFQPRPTPAVQAFSALVQLLDTPQPKVYARYVKSVTVDGVDHQESAPPVQPAPPQEHGARTGRDMASHAGHIACSDNRSYFARTLQSIDQAVNCAVNAILPWRQAQAQTEDIARNITDSPLAELNSTDYSVTETEDASTGQPDEWAECGSWCVHYRNDSQVLFAQQMKEFLLQTKIELGDDQQQALTEMLAGRDILFFYPQSSNSSRYRRRLDTDAQREWIAFDIEMHDKAVDKNSTSWKILSWSREQTDKGFAMFNIGIKEKDARWFAAAGLQVLAGYLGEQVSGVLDGTIFDRQPGETGEEHAMRLAMGLAQLPEGEAGRAFSNKPKLAPGHVGWRPKGPMDWPPGPGHPERPVMGEDSGEHPALRWGDVAGASNTDPVKEPPGTLLTHTQSGITLQSILQTEIDGQRWHLFPQAPYVGTAILPDVTPAFSRPAVRNPLTLQWRIEGVPGEHTFAHSAQPNFYLKSAQEYYRVKVSHRDGTLRLMNGEDFYFHQPSQQWKPFYHGNSHLHARCLSVIPEESVSAAPGQHQVLISRSGTEKRVWSTSNGRQYLEIRSPAENPNSEAIGYVEGWLEGDFFTLKSEPYTPLWQQTVLHWQAATQKWEVASSPFSLLSVLQRELPSDWLQTYPDPGALAAVYHAPGLYRHGGGYFLRWYADGEGTPFYLPLLPGGKATEYFVNAPGSEHIRLSYDAQQREWRSRILSLEAFADVPGSARIELNPPLSNTELVPGYEHLYRRDRNLYLHTGNGKYGTPEYSRVEQDAADDDVFRLRIRNQAADTEEHLLLRYDDDEEFVFDGKLQCKRIKRADQEPCASTSTADSSSGEPEVKKRRPYMDRGGAELEWFNLHPREKDEELKPEDNRYERRQKNLHYAARLSLLVPKEMPLKYIAQRADVDILSIRAWLRKTATQAKEWLAAHPQNPGESSIDYALRLSRMQQQGVSITDIAQHTRLRESSI